MGLISFIKDKGKKLFGGDEAPAAEVVSAEPADTSANDAMMCTEITKEIQNWNMNVQHLFVDVKAGTASLSGLADTQATREKTVLISGNVVGIETVDDNLTVMTPAPEANYVTVEKGDTLSKIAKEQYGDANKYHQIFEANEPMLSHPDKIYVGQVLRIPQA
jgi:nucleoid-associated protein YgaU